MSRHHPSRPTKHPPRSPGKLAVMRRRARLRLPLCLPGDAPMPADVVILPPPDDPEGACTLVWLHAGGFVVLR